MASAIVRSSLRTALRGGARVNPSSTRSFSSGASVEEEAREAAKWEKITYVGIAACSVLAFVNLSKGHPYFDEPPISPNFGYCCCKEILIYFSLFMVDYRVIGLVSLILVHLISGFACKWHYCQAVIFFLSLTLISLQ